MAEVALEGGGGRARGQVMIHSRRTEVRGNNELCT